MDTDINKVVVNRDPGGVGSQVHHRDFPEIRSGGKSPAEAASALVENLTRALDSALTDWRRESIEGAIADVKAYAEVS